MNIEIKKRGRPRKIKDNVLSKQCDSIEKIDKVLPYVPEKEKPYSRNFSTGRINPDTVPSLIRGRRVIGSFKTYQSLSKTFKYEDLTKDRL